MSKKGLGNTLVGGMIAVMIAVIVGGAIVIPIVTNVTAENLTGTEATVMGYVGLLIAVVIIVAVVSLIRA